MGSSRAEASANRREERKEESGLVGPPPSIHLCLSSLLPWRSSLNLYIERTGSQGTVTSSLPPPAMATSSSLHLFPAYYTSSPSHASFSWRKCEMTCHCPWIPVIGMHSRGRKAGEKKAKVGGSKGFGKSRPGDGITADIRERKSKPISKDVTSTTIEGHEDTEQNVAHTQVDEASGKGKDYQKDENNAPEAFLKKTTFVGDGARNWKDEGVYKNDPDLESTSVNAEDLEAVVKNSESVEIVEESGRVKEDVIVSNKIEEEQDTLPNTVKDAEKVSKTEVVPRPDAEQYRLQVKILAEKTENDGRIVFSFPEILKAGNRVEVFLNRPASALAEEPTVKISGAYNGWRWKHFEVQLEKTWLEDWWSCKLDVPLEAFNVDFVFHNGNDIYENNSNKDFSLLVEDGMDKYDFEDLLIEMKNKELERIAAERLLEEQRLAEQQRLIEKKAAEEADRNEARKQVNEQRDKMGLILQKAVRNVEGLWHFEPSEFQGGDKVKLFYNRSNRPLASSSEVWLHGGYNNWQDLVSTVGQLNFHSNDGGDWWTVDVQVPNHAYLLNWVLADGPPDRATLYDNNAYQDFHSVVPKNVPNDFYWKELEEQIYRKLQDERAMREEAAQKKAQHTAEIKEAFKTKTKNNIRKSQAHRFYTEPINVEAGKSVTVYYNPSNTVLNGKPEIWLRASFNRWTHKFGCLPPVKMTRSEGTTLVKATVRVPLDAYMMDFVLSERGDDTGGVFDNNHGMDYHVPVVGGFLKEPPMKIVHISVEMAPIAKVGGLGDVVTSLSRAIQELGHNVEVVLPKYDCLKYGHIKDLQEKSEFVSGGARVKVWRGTVEGLLVHFLEPDNGMFWAGCIYGRRDDAHRFNYFCRAALDFLVQSGQNPDIIHCHDWTSAPVAWLFYENYKQTCLANARIVFTIHNLEYGTALIGKAMAYADKATTVSETYASEVSGTPAISPHLYKFHGIRNGIDPDIWDPYNDPLIPLSYTSENVIEGKRAAKEELQSRLGLAKVDRPLLGIVTRLTAQKGVHLIKHAIWKTLERGGQVVLLGSAPDPRIQNDFNNLGQELHNSRGDMARLCLQYDEPLSHLIYAGADFILIPSMFEPCGLTQLTAMRYGAIPIVRRTGGLNDTVFDVDHDGARASYNGLEPNGFSFDGTDAPGVEYALNRALSAWYEARDWFNNLCKQAMEQDWSWNKPALDYIELYYSARR